MIMINRLYCPKCCQVIKYKERVYLDMLNSVLHQRCYTYDHEIKDHGTLKEIVNKYDFFEQFRIDDFLIK